VERSSFARPLVALVTSWPRPMLSRRVSTSITLRPWESNSRGQTALIFSVSAKSVFTFLPSGRF